MLLLTKRLFGDNRFQWPRTPDEARELTPEQFRRLMDGFAIEGSIKEIYTKQRHPDLPPDDDQLQLIHGYNRGTSLRSMIYDWYRYEPKVKRIMPGDNPGITILVLKELY